MKDDKPISPKAFALNIARAFRAEKGVATVEVNHELFELNIIYNSGGLKTANVFLGNFYDEYLRHGDFQNEVDRCLMNLRGTGVDEIFDAQSFDQVAHNLYPKLERREWVEQAERKRPPPQRRIYQPYHQDLAICYVWDTPSKVLFIPHQLRNQWDISVREMHERAMQNLISKAEETEWEIEIEEPFPRTCEVMSFDGYAASRLLCGEIIRAVFGTLDGELVAVVPHRDKLLIFDSPNIESGKIIKQVAAEWFEKSSRTYKLSKKVIPVPWDNRGLDQ